MPRPPPIYPRPLHVPGKEEIAPRNTMCLGTCVLRPRSNPAIITESAQTPAPFTPLPPPSLGLGLGMRRPPSSSLGPAARAWAWIGDGWAYEMDAFKIADDSDDDDYSRGVEYYNQTEKELSEKEKKTTSKQTHTKETKTKTKTNTNTNDHPASDTGSHSSPPRRNIFRRLFGHHRHPRGCHPSDQQRTHYRARWGKYMALLNAEQTAVDREGASGPELETSAGIQRRRAGTIPPERRLGPGCGLLRFGRSGIAGVGGNDEADWMEGGGTLLVQPEKEVDEGIARREGLWIKVGPKRRMGPERRVVVVEGEERLAEIVGKVGTVEREFV